MEWKKFSENIRPEPGILVLGWWNELSCCEVVHLMKDKKNWQNDNEDWVLEYLPNGEKRQEKYPGSFRGDPDFIMEIFNPQTGKPDYWYDPSCDDIPEEEGNYTEDC